MPEEAGKTYDTSERGGRYAPIRTDPENDAIQIHTDGEMPQGENTKNNHRQSNRNTNRPNIYGSIYYKGNFWVRKICLCYMSNLEPNKRHTKVNTGRRAKTTRHLAKQHDVAHHIIQLLKYPRKKRRSVIRFIRQSRN